MGEERSGHAVTHKYLSIVFWLHTTTVFLHDRPLHLTCGLCGPSAPRHRWPKGDQVTNVRQDTALPQLMEIDLHVTPN